MDKMPEGFPLQPFDAEGRRLEKGCRVRVNSVASCAKGLPEEDQLRLKGLVGAERIVVEIDRFGFVWLSFASDEEFEDFSLFPSEVSLIS